MKRKVRCMACKSYGLDGEFYKGKDGKYYCNEQEYKEYSIKEYFKNKILTLLREDIFGRRFIPPAIVKKIDSFHINYEFDYEVILRTVIKVKKELVYWLNKEDKFKNETQRANYMGAIIGNHINEVDKIVKRERLLKEELFRQQSKDVVDVDIINNINKSKSKKIKDISEFLD